MSGGDGAAADGREAGSAPRNLLASRGRSLPLASPFMAFQRRRPRVPLLPYIPAALKISAQMPPVVSTLLQDGGATLLVATMAYSLVRAFDVLTERRLIQQVSCTRINLPSTLIA